MTLIANLGKFFSEFLIRPAMMWNWRIIQQVLQLILLIAMALFIFEKRSQLSELNFSLTLLGGILLAATLVIIFRGLFLFNLVKLATTVLKSVPDGPRAPLRNDSLSMQTSKAPSMPSSITTPSIAGPSPTTLSFRRSLEIVSTATLMNHVLPSNIGAFYIVTQLKVLMKITVLQATLIQFLTFLIYLACDSLIAFLGLLLSGHSKMLLWLYGVILITLALMVIFTKMSQKKLALKNSLPFKKSLAPRLENSLRKISVFQKISIFNLIFKVAFPGLLGILGISLILGLFFQSYGLEISTAETLLFTGVRNTSLYLSLTPGALGISESILAFVGQDLKISAALAVTIGLFLRVVLSLPCCLFLFLSFLKGRFFKR